VASNYVDPDETRPVDLGECRCPVMPRPHVRDSAQIVARFGYGDRVRIKEAGGGAANQLAIFLGVRSWTLVLKDGTARPINPSQIYLLDEATVEALITDDALGAAMQDEPLPNAPSAPSPDGSQESAGPTPTTPTATETPPSSTST
jgi:hypothetical protein